MKVPFTAEVCARAIIASCACYGDDPVWTMTTRSSLHRRALPPAGAAIQIATGASRASITRALGLGETSIVNAEAKASAGHLKAKTAALAAIGGATAILAPEPGQPRRPMRPDPETVSDLPDALLAPRPMAPPISVEVMETKTLAAPPPAKAMSDRDAQICKMFDDGRSPSNIARALGLTVGVVSGVRWRYRPGAARAKEYTRVRAPREGRQVAAKPPKPDPGLVVGRASPAPAPRFERLEPRREDRVPQHTRDRIDAADQALIDAAIAAGKVRTVQPDGTSEFVFDPKTRLWTRRPIEARDTAVNGWGGRQKMPNKPRKNSPIHDPATAGRGVTP